MCITKYYTVETRSFEFQYLQFPIRQIHFLSQNYIFIAFKTHIMAEGPIVTSPNHLKCEYIRISGYSDL